MDEALLGLLKNTEDLPLTALTDELKDGAPTVVSVLDSLPELTTLPLKRYLIV